MILSSLRYRKIKVGHGIVASDSRERVLQRRHDGDDCDCGGGSGGGGGRFSQHVPLEIATAMVVVTSFPHDFICTTTPKS